MISLNSSYFRYSISIILALLIILLLHYTQFAYQPILDFAAALFFPLLLASILYYVLRPIVRLLEKFHIPRALAILLVYAFITVAIVTISSFVGPVMIQQIQALTSDSSIQFDVVKEKAIEVLNYFNLSTSSLAEFKDYITTFLTKIYTWIIDNIGDAIAVVAKFAIWLATTPFILYYFLKDDYKINKLFEGLAPKKYRRDAQIVLHDIDYSISTFIQSQLLVAFTLGVLLFLGYVAIGLNNALILALFAMLCITIPIFGSFIALIPALLVGLTEGSWMGIKVILVMMTAQIIEGNFISPQILGQRLQIHPLVLMLILLASGSLYGVLGLLLATPVYVILRVIVTKGYAFYNRDVSKATV